LKVLVIGSGGREHALAWRLARAPRVSRVYVAPGNAGTATEEGVENVAVTATQDDLIDFVRKESVALTVVGPEAPLAEGIVDRFQAEGLKIFGPTRAAAQLESSKDFAKSFMTRHRIPTAAYATFTDAAAAHIAQGSSVTHRVQPSSRGCPIASAAARIATISAWAVGSNEPRIAFLASATISSPRVMTAPTGTSPARPR